jgi:hypothetical protein
VMKCLFLQFKVPPNKTLHNNLHDGVIFFGTGSWIIKSKFRPNRRSAIHSFCSMFFCGNITILWFKKKLDPEATFITRRTRKKTDGRPKEYHLENNFALASFVVSSQYGRLLQAAVTV